MRPKLSGWSVPPPERCRAGDSLSSVGRLAAQGYRRLFQSELAPRLGHFASDALLISASATHRPPSRPSAASTLSTLIPIRLRFAPSPIGLQWTTSKSAFGCALRPYPVALGPPHPPPQLTPPRPSFIVPESTESQGTLGPWPSGGAPHRPGARPCPVKAAPRAGQEARHRRRIGQKDDDGAQDYLQQAHRAAKQEDCDACPLGS